MNYLRKSGYFAGDESGAVTVDWVVLTSALVGLGIIVMTTIGTASNEVGENISSNLKHVTIKVQ